MKVCQLLLKRSSGHFQLRLSAEMAKAVLDAANLLELEMWLARLEIAMWSL